MGPSGREVPKRLNRKGLSTVAGRAGGPVRSSGEAPVTGAERRGRVVRDCVRSINRKCSGRNRMDELKAPGKPFGISKRAVWEAWEKVKANKGAPGVDAVTIAEFESDLKNNLYKIWNRLSALGITPSRVAGRARSAQFTSGGRGCRRCRTASWWRRIKISAVCHASSRCDSRSHAATRVIRRNTNRRHM